MARTFGFPTFRRWPPRRSARIVAIEAEAEALIREFGAAAYAEARKREDEASSEALARDWERVALAVARKMTSAAGTSASERMAARVALVPDRREASPPTRRHRPAPRPLEGARPSLEARPQRFRIQYVGAASDCGSSILKEVETEVLDVSAAIVEAANLVWPRGTTALRILDREGREVFERHRADRR